MKPFRPAELLLMIGVQNGDVAEIDAAGILCVDLVSFRERMAAASAHAKEVAAPNSRARFRVEREPAIMMGG